MADKKNEKAATETKADEGKPLRKYRIVGPAKGFRRAGRLWQGVTEVPVNQLTPAQIKQIKAEPRLTIVEI